MMAPAPSQMPDAVPAVTVPFFLKTGGSLFKCQKLVKETLESYLLWSCSTLANISMVVCTRGCSSVSKETGFFLISKDTGANSAVK